MDKLVCESYERFMELADVENFDEAVSVLWNDIHKLFNDGERELLAVYYDDEKRYMHRDTVDSAERLAFIAAGLFSNFGGSLANSYLMVIDTKNNNEIVFSIEYGQLESDYEDDEIEDDDLDDDY